MEQNDQTNSESLVDSLSFEDAKTIKEYFDVALALTKECGQLIKERIWRAKTVNTKAHAADLVTETDREIENKLMTQILQKFPSHKFIGEETTADGVKQELTDAPTWIIDPVDGTLNFVHGYPNVCISVGLAIEKKLVVGIIYVPVPDMMFTALKGKGAFLNGCPIHVSKVTDLANAMVTMEFSAIHSGPFYKDIIMEYFTKICSQVQGVRTSGSAAYNLAMVAIGGSDAYFEVGIHVWDIAAGIVIVEEAGGVVLDPSGGPVDIMSRKVLVASTKELAAALASCIPLKPMCPKRDDA